MLPDEMMTRIELMESFDPDVLEDELESLDDDEIAAALEEPGEPRV